MRRIALVMTTLTGLTAAACINLPWNRAEADLRPVTNEPDPIASTSLLASADSPGAKEGDAAKADELIAAAKKAYTDVKTYRCVFVKREQVRGRMTPEEVMLMSVRVDPLAIHMKFLEPNSVAGQEVCYNSAKSKTHFRAKSAGLAGAIGFINLKLDDVKAMVSNRHTIAEGGFGGLIDLAADARKSGAAVTVSRFKFDKKPCSRIEFVAAANDAKPYAARMLIYFDESSHLPIRMEAFGPATRTSPDGELLEQYNYTDLLLNPQVSDSLFSK